MNGVETVKPVKQMAILIALPFLSYQVSLP
jgi:hypothetical protein